MSAEPPQSQPSPRNDLSTLVQDLGDTDFHVRENAEQKLWEAGPAALPLLRAAVDGPDPEIAARAHRILTDLDWGLVPGTPRTVMELLREYRSANVMRKGAIVNNLERVGGTSANMLGRLWVAETDPAIRRAVFGESSGHAALNWASYMIGDGDELKVPDMMRTLAYTGDDTLARNAAAWFLLSGTLEAETAAAQKFFDAGGSKEAGKFLIYARRAAGDLAGASKIAAQLRDDIRLADLAQERGDWAAAEEAFKNAPNPWSSVVPYAGRLAAYARLTGDQATYDREMSLLKARNLTPEEVLKSFCLNDQPAEGLLAVPRAKTTQTVLNRNGSDQITLLCTQLRFKEATEIAERDDHRDPKSMLPLATALYRFGGKTKAIAIFDELQSAALANKDDARFEMLFSAYQALGLNDRAKKLACEILRLSGESGQTIRYLNGLIPTSMAGAESWWSILRPINPHDSHEQRIDRLEALFAGKLPADEARDILMRGKKSLKPDGGNHLLICDMIRLSAGQSLDDDNLETYADSAAGPEPFETLGQVLAAKGLWERAATAYEHAWKLNRLAPIPEPLDLALEGNALEKAGHAAEGRALVERAHRMMLGGDRTRGHFIDGLRQNGMEADAKREGDLALLVGAFDDHAALGVLEKRAIELSANDPLAAANLNERERLWILRPGASFRNAGSYLVVPHHGHARRAEAYAAKGDVDAALREWKICLAYLPYDADTASNAVRALDKAGRGAEADALYEPIRDGLKSLCNDYPDSPTAHNNVAWLAARCRRDLDLALAEATKATELDPKNAAYIDTLAEVHLARGDKAGALDLMHKAIEFAPDVAVLKARLKEFEGAK